MADKPVIINASLVTQILDLVGEIVHTFDASIPVRFEELTAETGQLSRIMMTLVDGAEEESRYISGETICPIMFALTLRVAPDDEQDRLNAAGLLDHIRDQFLEKCLVLDDFAVYRLPKAGMPVCLGRTDTFEDWQVTFDVKYNEMKGA